MDIKHLNYFIEVVEQNFNLTKAAEVLYISQPTLSIMINDFERNRDVKLFQRKGQKIVGLTTVGERYYHDALSVIEQYNEMIHNLKHQDEKMSGKVVLGIPPLAGSLLFADVLPQLIEQHPQVKFDIVEKGAEALKAALLADQLDIAMLLTPLGLPDHLIESYEIAQSEMVVFTSKKSELAQSNQLVDWFDLRHQRQAILDPVFMIHHQLNGAFYRRGLDPNVFLKSITWDLLINTVRLVDDLYTILPIKITDIINTDDLAILPMKEPLNWCVNICRLKKSHYEPTEDRIFRELVEQFDTPVTK